MMRILSLEAALEHIPQNPTYAIRIESGCLESFDDLPLKHPLYCPIRTYTFDDVEPGMLIDSKEILFKAPLAKKIIEEFRPYSKTHDILVHCLFGRNRSPAIGIALNDIFDLGQDTEALKQKFSESNWYVYRTLITAGR